MKHGAGYAYKVKGCRCDACRDWRAASQRAYNQRRRAREPGWVAGRRRQAESEAK